MTIAIVLIIVGWGLSLTIFLTNQNVKQNDTAMGIKVPYGHMKDEDVASIIAGYKKRTFILWLLFVLCLLPLLFLYKYISICLIFLTIWYLSYFLLSNSLRRTYIRKMYILKQFHKWNCNEKSTEFKSIMQVRTLKESGSLNIFWYYIPMFFSFFPIINIIKSFDVKSNNIWLACISPIIAIIVAVAYFIFKHENFLNNYFVDDEADEDIVYYFRRWSYVWLILDIVHCFGFSIIYYLFTYKVSYAPIISLLILLIIASVGVLIVVNTKKKRLLPKTQKYQCYDEDTYWLSGGYSNPNDPRTMVPSRFLGGMTINMASPGGKFLRIFLIGTTVFVLLRFIFLLPIDFGDITIKIADKTIFIDAPKRDFEVKKEEIEEITYKIGIPSMVKTDATDAYRFYLGCYNVSNHGLANVYLYKKTPNYIEITTRDGTVMINAETSDKTEELYEQLLKWVEE